VLFCFDMHWDHIEESVCSYSLVANGVEELMEMF